MISHKQVLDLHWQLANTNTGRVVHRIGDCRSNTGKPDLADAACAELVDLLVGIIEEVHVDWRRVGVYGHDVVSQVAVDRRAVLWIERSVFKKRHADAHHYRALNLVSAGQRIHDVARIHHRHHAAHTQSSDLWLPRDLGEVTAK